MSLLRNTKRIFRKLTPVEVAAHELAEAELKRLEALSGREWAEAMVQYHERRISRLRAFLAQQNTRQEPQQ